MKGVHDENPKLNRELKENKITLSVPSDIRKIYKLFKKNKKQLYIVGGQFVISYLVNDLKILIWHRLKNQMKY